MRPARHWETQNWADALPAVLGIKNSPVDLYAVARHRRIRTLGFRFMIPRGLMLPVEGGFDVYLRDQARRDTDISKEEPSGALSVRQRFSLAHEIAHTRFYKLSDRVPSSEPPTANGLELERICDQMAGCILIPTHLLKRKISDYGKEIDANFVRLIAEDFQTSMDVALNRIRVVEAGSSFDRCILLARRVSGDAEIQTLHFGIGLWPLLPRPEKYTRVTDWLPDFPRNALIRSEESGSFVTPKGRIITFKTTEVGTGDRILLELRAG